MSADDTLPWTTSRCNRLLRPLSCKLAKLRRELERPRSSGGESRNVSSAFATKGSPHKTTNFTRPVHKPRGFDKASDPDWKPGAKPTAGKKTYGGRAGRKVAGLQSRNSNVGNVARPGEIAFTPLIARMGTQLQSSPMAQISPLKKYGKNKGPLLVGVDLCQAPRHMSADLYKLVQGLMEAYANLLQATSTGDEKRWKGTRSLMGACLRKMPAYIELEEHFAEMDRLEEEEETEDRDVSHEIYEHLEARFEQRAGNGWRPFKQVVRAHATSLLCNAISDELLGLDSLSVMVTHCLNVSAWDEAERLLLAYVPFMEPLSMPVYVKSDLFDTLKQPFLALFRGYVERTGRYRLIYDLLEHMVAVELLPLEWLATECMRPFWDRLVRTISENDLRSINHSLQFMETVTLASIGLPDVRLLEDEVMGSTCRRFVPSSRDELRLALNTTFSSLLTVLCSIALVSNNREDPTGKLVAQRIRRALDATVVAISLREDLHDELKMLGADVENVQVFAQRALSVNFASALVHLEGCDDLSKTPFRDSTLSNVINWIAAQFSIKGINFASVLAGLPSLVASIARGTGRIWQDDGFDQVQRLVAALMSTSGFRLPHKLWTLKRIALESAMEFAYGTGVVEHMIFARSIEQTMRTQGRVVIVQSPEKDAPPTASGGFKWEEGIGEWVACTPFAKQNVKRQPRQPLRALDFLPTPVQSEDENIKTWGTDRGLPKINDDWSWETTAFDIEDDEDAVPQSSPIKKAPRASTSSLGKRTRASSPVVLIPSKRLQLTPPDTPKVLFYPTLRDEDKNESEEEERGDAPRRSRRSKKDLKALTSQLRTQRSRRLLDGGLRNIDRPTYAETDLVSDSDMEEGSSDASKSVAEAESESPPPPPVQSHRSSRISLRRQSSRPHTYQEHNDDNDNEDEDETSDPDELGKTPVQPQARAQRKRTSRYSLNKTKRGGE
ncbi:hypothetical protein T440DRAFT_468826 [Plenodomus tracheiphilus IPT5]|uniref:Uncharacterized protein n=1 Tax=Plenodomus tracheiphilus IPT5 TaxID=1408161 RepID=A0A6A7B617_9PLEO|nr:hypothetical protein T440DRAFT_468826 [Plenodomus tracheiphilus IPT5]